MNKISKKGGFILYLTSKLGKCFQYLKSMKNVSLEAQYYLPGWRHLTQMAQ